MSSQASRHRRNQEHRVSHRRDLALIRQAQRSALTPEQQLGVVELRRKGGEGGEAFIERIKLLISLGRYEEAVIMKAQARKAGVPKHVLRKIQRKIKQTNETTEVVDAVTPA